MPTATRKKAGSSRKAAASKGLSVQTFKGLNEKRMEKRGGSGGKRLNLKQGDTAPVQMLQSPDEFTEYFNHSWQDGDRWWFVPCAGEDCPLCADDDDKKSKKSYRFACNVYNLKDRKVQILEGPKDLAGRIMYRYKRNPARFLKRTYEVTKYPTTPVSYDFQVGEDDLVVTRGLKLHDIDVDLEEQLKSFYGDDMPDRSSLDEDEDAVDDDDLDDDEDEDEDIDEEAEDEDEEDEEDEAEDEDEDEEADEDEDEDAEEDDESYTRNDLSKLKIGKLREIAETLDIDTDGMGKPALVDAILEETGEDEDEEEAEDEDEEEEAPPVRKSAAKKAPAKTTAAAKKAPARRRR